ncbi:hypothetical protein EW146_g4139 [Bondarzewia mesenterica]|uniref:Uncharacterized protein n=1 Tax=Bondarzewia mesenterica TaxID=1095465 RepID=A0A4S4LVL5_9AGAM|nr:hypothetical protein EW146_g4139 [Bondarzewia mesenterica]
MHAFSIHGHAEWDLREKVVYEMTVRDLLAMDSYIFSSVIMRWNDDHDDVRERTNVVQEYPALPPQEIPIHRRECAAHERPLTRTVVRQARIAVLKKHYHGNPVRHKNPRHEIYPNQDRKSQARAHRNENADKAEEADI